ncbi:MAG TPA: hypothetical protein VHO47_01345 [Candidatus Babeliales bacterium]|nr:hypothetical protein [Candidatus Babeliales bacterium]
MQNKLTSLQAFNAMRKFLELYYTQTSSDEVGSLLGDLQILKDGKTADPAAWNDWIGCVEEILKRD